MQQILAIHNGQAAPYCSQEVNHGCSLYFLFKVAFIKKVLGLSSLS
jgi:hypothetical protein